MTREEIKSEFKSVLEPYVKDKALLENLHDDTNLLNDLQINSAYIVDIVLDAETRYNIEIDDDSYEKMYTLGTCIDVIQQKLDHANSNR